MWVVQSRKGKARLCGSAQWGLPGSRAPHCCPQALPLPQEKREHVLCTHLASALQAWLLGCGRGRNRLLSGVLEDTPWALGRFLTGPAQASCTTGGRLETPCCVTPQYLGGCTQYVTWSIARVQMSPAIQIMPCCLSWAGSHGPTWRFYR